MTSKTSHPSQPTTSSNSKGLEQDGKRIETLFLRFSVIYGYLWHKAYQNEALLTLAKKEWQVGLRPFDNMILKAALQHCREYASYPPSLPQFIELCRAIKKRQNFFKRSPENEDIASPETAEFHLKKMKAYLASQSLGEKL